jgi:hypothetical protein
MPEPATGTTAALGKALDVAKELGLLQRLKAKLIGDPNAAAQHLTMALTEVRRTLSALRDTLLEVSYLGVPGQDLVDVRRALDRIESGRLYEEVIHAKGRCSMIANIYDRHLQAWFKTLLDPQEQQQVHTLFNDLRDSDGWAIAAMEGVLNDAKPLSKRIRVLFEEKKKTEAHQLARDLVTKFRPTIDKLSETIAFMLNLEAEFIQRRGLT